MAREVRGAADLGRLTPPRPLPPIPTALVSQRPWKGAACKAGWNLGVRASIWLLGRNARVCLHVHTCTRIHAVGTLWAMHLLSCTAKLRGQAELGGARRRTLVCACLRTNAATHAHTLYALRPLTAWLAMSEFP